MALPIDVGPPVYTSRAANVITGSNLSTAMRLYLWDDNAGGIADEDGAIYFPVGSGIHARTQVDINSPALDAAHLQLNLHLLNPIGYNNLSINRVLLDFLIDQAHVGCGVVRMLPNGVGSPTAWIPSSGSSGHNTYVDEPMDAVELGNFLYTVTAGAEERLRFPSVPSNASSVRELIAHFFGALTKGPSGSDEGLGFGFQLKDTVLGNLSRLVYGDMYADGSVNGQRVKLDRLNLSPSTWNASTCALAVTAGRGLVGPSPNPLWRLYNLELLVYYTISDPDFEIIDQASFTDLDSYCSSHLLDFDVLDGTYYEALLDILAHMPELFLYVGWDGKLRLKRVDDFAGATKRPLSIDDGSILAVKRGPYALTERYANAVELRWGVTIPHISAASAAEDPTNPDPDRGARKYRRGAAGIPVALFEDTKTLERHFVRRDSNKTVAENIAAMYLHLWGRKDARGIDLRCPISVLDVEPGDVVEVTVPNLALSATPFLVVEKTLDLAKDEVDLVIYNVENTL